MGILRNFRKSIYKTTSGLIPCRFQGPVDMEGEKIVNLADGEEAGDAVNVSQLGFEHPLCMKQDGSVPMEGPLDMAGHAIVGVEDPGEDQEAATKKYVDDGAGLLLKKNGSEPMEAALNMGSHKIVALGDPDEEGPQDVATKNYVDTEIVGIPKSPFFDESRLTTIRHGKATLSAGIASVTFAEQGYLDMDDTNYMVFASKTGTGQASLGAMDLSVTNLATTGFTIECEAEEATDDVFFLVLGLKAGAGV